VLLTPAATAPQEVLVVDDDPSVLALVVDALALEGYRVQAAHNGAEALHLMGQLPPPRVLVTDLAMPVLDGCELVQAVRQMAAASAVPAILVITAETEGAIERVRALGLCDVLRKPFDLEDLLGMVARLLVS
jgi:CheY-like chemotaxis protein